MYFARWATEKARPPLDDPMTPRGDYVYISGMSDNGMTYLNFSRNASTGNANDHQFQKGQPWYLFMGMGPKSGPDINYHTATPIIKTIADFPCAPGGKGPFIKL